MPSRRRSPEVSETDNPDGTPSTETPTSLTEAGDEVAAAEARAEAARARAVQLRRAAESAETNGKDAVGFPVERRLARLVRSRPRWIRRPGRKPVAVGAGIVLGCASLAASGYMLWQDRTVMHKRQLAPQFAAAARRGVATVMSIDPAHAKEDIQRGIAATTGDLKAQLEARSTFMVQQAEESKVISKVTVEAVGVESVSDSSGVALVAAKSDVTNADNTKRPPMLWRLSVTIERDAGQLKMSRIDFLQ